MDWKAFQTLRNGPDREQLEELSDAELLRKAAREVLIAVCVAVNAMMRQAACFVTKPAEVGALMRGTRGMLPGRDSGTRPGAEHGSHEARCGTAHPNAEWIARQLTKACGWKDAPRYLVRDRDGAYGEAFIFVQWGSAIDRFRLSLHGKTATRNGSWFDPTGVP